MPRVEVRFHGRGGQGAVTAAEILASAAILEGKFAMAFPEYGAERRGAPVLAYTRIDDDVILEREPILEPHIVAVLDSSLDPSIYMRGLRADGAIVVNTQKSVEGLVNYINSKGFQRPRCVAVVNATEVAVKHLGAPIVNTAILGALVRATKVVELDSLEKVVEEKFADRPRLIEANIRAIEDAYSSTEVACL
ncbi:MAG: 2-oxoacid:acceptor oxidoreductase family protein [Thermoproteota archaeon]